MPPANPKVSVLVLAYNHEKYIEQAIRSALDQDVDFDIEIVIGEDCSTDSTRDLLQPLADANPETIRLLLRDKNLGGTQNFYDTLRECRGEFVAILEGDDYWTDSRKLGLQVAALEEHSHWSCCFHRVEALQESGVISALFPPEGDFPRESTLTDLFEENFIGTASILFRRGLFNEFPAEFHDLVQQDLGLHLLNAEHGKIGFLDETMAVYRIHSASLWSPKSESQRWVEIFRALDVYEDYFQGKYRSEIRDARLKRLNSLFERIDELYHSRSYRLARMLMSPLRYVWDRVKSLFRSS